jgi:hypothetical protein
MPQATIDKILSGKMPTSELLALLDDKNVFVRANAVRQISRRVNDRVMQKIIDFVKNPENRKARFLGAISLSFLGVLTLCESENDKAKKAALQLISLWENEDEKDELISFLESE